MHKLCAFLLTWFYVATHPSKALEAARCEFLSILKDRSDSLNLADIVTESVSRRGRISHTNVYALALSLESEGLVALAMAEEECDPLKIRNCRITQEGKEKLVISKLARMHDQQAPWRPA